jgi:hypothetical protein
MLILAVGVGGALGPIARYLLGGLVHRLTPSLLPDGTFVVNVVGCLCFGLVVGLAESHFVVGPGARAFILIGVLGGFTTVRSIRRLSRRRGHGDWRARQCGRDPGIRGTQLAADVGDPQAARSDRIVDAAEKIEAFLPCLDEMVQEGLVTLERTEVILYRAPRAPRV